MKAPVSVAHFLEHLGECPEADQTFARVLAGDQSARHVCTLVGALMTTENTLASDAVIGSNDQQMKELLTKVRADLDALYTELLRAHLSDLRFDA